MRPANHAGRGAKQKKRNANSTAKSKTIDTYNKPFHLEPSTVFDLTSVFFSPSRRVGFADKHEASNDVAILATERNILFDLQAIINIRMCHP